MRAPFRDAQAALIAAKYQCSPQYEVSVRSTGVSVVFGGEAICLVYFGGGSYSDNGGRNYSAAEVDLCPRYHRRPDYVEALRMAKAEHVALTQVFRTVPRSDRQAAEMLARAAEFDGYVASHLDRAKEITDAAEAARVAEVEAGRRRSQVSKIAAGELVTEVLKLYREGLLDDSNVLKGLRDIAEELNGLSPAPTSPG